MEGWPRGLRRRFAKPIMDYVLAIPVGNKTYNFTIKDWLFLIDENSLVNVSTITKLGIPIAKLSIGFKKI